MRQVHQAGEREFVDFSGKKPRIYDPKTGEATEVELFVAVLGASSYTYAEATRTQQLEEFVGATERSFLYFGAVPEMVVPDQLKSAVKTSDWYEPEINETYHYCWTLIVLAPDKEASLVGLCRLFLTLSPTNSYVMFTDLIGVYKMRTT